MKSASFDQELEALKTTLLALDPLDDAQRRFVLKTVTERLGVSVAVGSGVGGADQSTDPASHAGIGVALGGGNPITGGGGVLKDQTPKQFLKMKMPKTDVQRVACLAFYLTHARGQNHFKTEDLTKLNTEAGGTPISNPSMAVANATNQNAFLGAVGQAKKQITALGEDVVGALPNEEAVKGVLANYRKPRKKRTKRIATKTS